MKKVMIASLMLAFLAACGGGGTRYSSGNAVRGAIAPIVPGATGAPVVLFATGPISDACLRAGRKAASRAKCGCVQAVADMHLNASEQRKGATFFSDPQRAQDLRQSDNSANERFWKAWKAYGQEAEQLCRTA